MSTTTDRVHFYERQYLRALDLVAEQTYHLEMRRRLNVALHLWGIVSGFDVAKGAIVPGAPEQFIVSPGMAIDGFGREIVSAQAYALSSEDLRRNRIQVAGDYWLSIAYRRELTTPPSPGYRLCNLDDQFTRWRETVAFLITAANPTPSSAPDLTGPLPDDPATHDWPVVLGKVRVVSSGGNLEIGDAWLEGRTYVGSRTERLVSPVASLPAGTAESLRPIRIEADGLAVKDFAVGENFVVNPGDVITPPPLPAPFPAAQGSLKVQNDLFVKREIYKYDSATNKWATLTSNIRQFVPDVQVKQQEITFSTGAVTQPVEGFENVEFETILENPSEKHLTVALAGTTRRNVTDLVTWVGAIPADQPWQIDVRPEGAATLVGPKKWRFPVKWTIGPMSTDPLVPLSKTKIRISCVAVFLP